MVLKFEGPSMSKISYSLENRILKIDGHLTNLNAEVHRVLEFNGVLIVLINKYLNDSLGTPAANVFALSSRGEILWQIEEFDMKEETTFYTNIYLENGNLIAFNPKGFACTIDKNTGKILSSEFTK